MWKKKKTDKKSRSFRLLTWIRMWTKWTESHEKVLNPSWCEEKGAEIVDGVVSVPTTEFWVKDEVGVDRICKNNCFDEIWVAGVEDSHVEACHAVPS